jgi:Nucleoside 2-deoxyribosyltransferase like
MLQITAPSKWIKDTKLKYLFLAGTIEMGASENWQSKAVARLENLAIVLLNPRRLNWDLSIRPEADEPLFREQVEWELDALERADHIFMYFLPGSKSPITLLEFGLFARSGRLTVCCPDGFWRRGNVLLTCERFRVPVIDSLYELPGLLESI